MNIDEYKNILNVISEQYLGMYILDTKKSIIIDIKNNISYKISEGNDKFQQEIYNFISKFASLENIPKMKFFTDLSTLQGRMKDKKIISTIFHGKNHEWCNSKLIKLGQDDFPHYLLFIVEKVDDQILHFEEQKKEIKENKKLHSMMDAFMDEYNTVCNVNLETKRIDFSQLSERFMKSYQSATRIGFADELARMYVGMSVHDNDKENMSRLLSIEYVKENLEVGNSLSYVFQNELGEYMEVRIFRNSENDVFLGFKDKNLEIEEINNKLHTDSLTGIKNRKYYDEEVISQPCQAIIISDIDYFKDVNDTYGHQCGDEVIAKVAKTLQSCVRKSDDVIRYGGDEFVIAFNEITYEALENIMEKMRSAIEKITIKEYPKIKLSMSFGAAYGNGIAEEMISVADNALYESKETRNTITIDSYPKVNNIYKKIKKIKEV